MSFECQVSLCTSCNEHQTYRMEMHDVSCCVWMLWKDAKHPDAVFKLTLLTILGLFAVSAGAWGLLGGHCCQTQEQRLLCEGSPVKFVCIFHRKFFLHVVNTWRIHVLTSTLKPNIQVVSHVKQISSTIPFHQIKVKLNGIAIASVVCFLVRISTETN